MAGIDAILTARRIEKLEDLLVGRFFHANKAKQEHILMASERNMMALRREFAGTKDRMSQGCVAICKARSEQRAKIPMRLVCARMNPNES